MHDDREQIDAFQGLIRKGFQVTVIARKFLIQRLGLVDEPIESSRVIIEINGIPLCKGDRQSL